MILSIEIIVESREGIVGKKFVIDGNLKIFEIIIMVFESLLIILLVEKEQKISLFKCLFKFEKIE